jgi:carotenoid cleavage dioxygenase-like enzyme
MKDNNWVNLLPLPGAEGLLLTDSPYYVRMDYETLETNGEYAWKDGGMSPTWMDKGHVGTFGSAHPLKRPNTDSEYVAIIVEMDVNGKDSSAVGVYSIDVKTMDRQLIGSVPTKGVQYLHSFGLTENYVVLPMDLKIGRPDSMEMVKLFADGWNGIHVLNMKTKEVQVFETDPFFHVHIANTFENATGIVMDLGVFDAIPFSVHALGTDHFLNKTERDGKRGSLHRSTQRFHMHLDGPLKGQVTREGLSPPGRFTDFFKINDFKNGMPYCIYYAVEWFHDGTAYASQAVLKNDICQNKRTYWSKENQYVSEPFFVPLGNESDAEDHGLLVFVVLNGPRQASDFVVLDAKTFEEIAVVELPVHIPFTAHGQFMPKGQLQKTVKDALALEHPELSAAIDAFTI